MTVVYEPRRRLDIDRILAERGIERRFAVSVPGFACIPPFLRGSTMLTTLPGLLQRDLMRGFADSGRSLLGVCLGSQLLARAYGGADLIGRAGEFGWQPVALTPEGAADPIFAGTPVTFPIFQWHDDTFTLPPGATRLAAAEGVENQAFVIGRAAYGVQFHFEADRPLVAEWSRDYADLLARIQPGWAERHPAEAARLGPASDAAGLAMRNWVGTLARA